MLSRVRISSALCCFVERNGSLGHMRVAMQYGVGWIYFNLGRSGFLSVVLVILFWIIRVVVRKLKFICIR